VKKFKVEEVVRTTLRVVLGWARRSSVPFAERKAIRYHSFMEVLTALIADSASDYQGKLCVLGSFDTICARQYPAVHPHCSIALRLLFRTGDEGKHTIQISFIDSDGKAILPEGGPRIEFTMGEPPAQAFFWSQNFIFNIAGLRLPSPGQYSLDVLYDGKIVSRIPLQGVLIQQPAQQG